MPAAAPKEPAGGVVWSPRSLRQARFLAAPFWEVLLHGPKGTGKTDALLMSYLQHVGKGYGPAWRGILFRRTYKQLAEVVQKGYQWIPRIFPGAEFNRSEMTWTFSGGESLLLRYMRVPDDYWEYHGHSYPWIGWEELTSWPSLECYDRMKACSRVAGDIPRLIRSNTNPWGVGHSVVKRRFIDVAPEFVPVRGADGEMRCHIAGSIDETRRNYGDQYARSLESDEDAVRREAWAGGSWEIAAGGMFADLWRDAIHELRPFEIPEGWYVNRAFDWGSSKPFSVGWYAESNGEEVELADGSKRAFPRGTVIRVAEWYGQRPGEKPNVGVGLLSSEIARGIREMEGQMAGSLGLVNVRPGPADSAIYDAGHDGRSIADEMARNGVKWVKATKGPGSRVSGWEVCRERLSAARAHPMEEAGFFVFDTCRHFIRQVTDAPRDDKNPDDIDTEAEDHALDEWRYRLTTPRHTATSQPL